MPYCHAYQCDVYADATVWLYLYIIYVLLHVLARRKTGGKWRTMLGISIVPPFMILSSLCLLPESPRWLLGKGREDKAFAVLCRVRTKKTKQCRHVQQHKLVSEFWTRTHADVHSAELSRRRQPRWFCCETRIHKPVWLNRRCINILGIHILISAFFPALYTQLSPLPFGPRAAPVSYVAFAMA